jgi:hypothetical protein
LAHFPFTAGLTIIPAINDGGIKDLFHIRIIPR